MNNIIITKKNAENKLPNDCHFNGKVVWDSSSRQLMAQLGQCSARFGCVKQDITEYQKASINYLEVSNF